LPENDFVVDGFTLRNKDDYKDWFLTHFHSDHYVGIQKKFNHGTIYASDVTCKLVKMKLGVDQQYLKPLDFNVRYNIKGTYVTLMEANHCPGSAVILFELPSGRCILHTGDFRFNKKIFSKYDALKPFFSDSHHQYLLKTDPTYKPAANRRKLDALYLDTTYCDPQYTFPEQEQAVQLVTNIVKEKKKTGGNVLFLIGTYHIGKEKVSSRIAQETNCKVFVTYDKMRSIRCLNLSDEQIYTTNVAHTNVCVVPMCHLGWKKLFENPDVHRYDEVVAFKPSAWCFKEYLNASLTCPFNKENGREYKKVPVQYTRKVKITLVQVPYSEHSSFTELQQCCEILSTERIVPTVYRNQSQLRTIMYHLTEGRRFPNKMGSDIEVTIPDHLIQLPGPPNPKKQKTPKTPVKTDSSVRTLFDMAKSGINFVKSSVFGSNVKPEAVKQETIKVHETKTKNKLIIKRSNKPAVSSASDDVDVIEVDDVKTEISNSMLDDSQNIIDMDEFDGIDFDDVNWGEIDRQVQEEQKAAANSVVNVDDYESSSPVDKQVEIKPKKLSLKRKGMDSPSPATTSKKTKVETPPKMNLFSFWGNKKQ